MLHGELCVCVRVSACAALRCCVSAYDYELTIRMYSMMLWINNDGM